MVRKVIIKAVGYAFDVTKGDWTERVEYLARGEREARDWMKMNEAWFKNMHIEREVA